MDYIETNKTEFMFQGQKIRLHGFGIGTWLTIEHFMVGLPGSEESIRSAIQNVYGKTVEHQFFNAYEDTFFKEEDVKLLHECGVNFIRVPFNYRLFLNDEQPEKLKEEGFARFNRLFDLCRPYDMFVLLDLHTTPGGQNPDWHSDNSLGVPMFWKYQVFRKQMTRLWGEIAKRYSKEPALMGYDLLNEPAMAGWDRLNSYYKETIAAIRSVDSNHVIVLEGDGFSMNFSGLEKFQDSNLAITFHYYPTVWHPELLDPNLERKQRKEKIADGLERILMMTKAYNCPVFCGEFGYGRDCGEWKVTSKLLLDTIDIFEKWQIDWLLWCYKDAHFMSMISPMESTTWMKLAREVEKEWTQEVEKEQAEDLLNQLQTKWYPRMTKQERYLLQFRFRACFYPLQRRYCIEQQLQKISKEELLHMAYDFSYERCEVDEKLMAYIKRQLQKTDDIMS